MNWGVIEGVLLKYESAEDVINKIHTNSISTSSQTSDESESDSTGPSSSLRTQSDLSIQLLSESAPSETSEKSDSTNITGSRLTKREKANRIIAADGVVHVSKARMFILKTDRQRVRKMPQDGSLRGRVSLERSRA